MKVAWVGTFDPTFSRNRRLARLLDLTAIEVDIIRMDLWTTDRVATAARGKARALLRGFLVYPRLIWRLLRAPTPDVYLVSYPGWFDVPFVWLAARLRRRPLVFDPFFLLYETVVEDRTLFARSSLVAWIVRRIDVLALRLPDWVVADTAPHLAYYKQLSGGRMRNGSVVEVGADDQVFKPSARPDTSTQVLFYGSFVPLQGIETIIEAAGLLRATDIRFTLIGDGQERPRIAQLISDNGLTNVQLRDPVSLEALPVHIADSSLCLGIFGTSEKADRVIAHKVFECLASGRAVISRDSAALRAAFTDSELEAVPAGNGAALAAAITSLCEQDALRDRYATAGQQAYRTRFHETILSAKLAQVFEQASTRRRV